MPLTINKTLPFNLKIAGKAVRDIEVRPSTMQDVLDVEREASPMQPSAFNVQMACRQIVRAGDFTGPFVASHFSGLRPKQFGVIADALREADELGEE